MKLISCQITGFGKFVNQAFDLSKPVSVFRGENGWGKTTLADFLESMFYGIDGGRSKSVTDNNRIKYEPWSGARFGGAITFTHNQRTYRVERFFGKTPSADVVRVFDGNNMLCYDFGERAEHLGEALFGVDRESYRRTAYLPQGQGQTGGLTGDIRSKLLAVLTAEQTTGGGQNAIDRLDAAERALRAKRRPAKGKLDEIDEKLVYIQEQKADCVRAAQAMQAQKQELSDRLARLQTVSAELEKLTAAAEEYTRRSEMAAMQAAREEMQEKLTQAKEKLAQWDVFFNGNDSQTLNTAGLENAVKEYYDGKEALAKLEEEFASLTAQMQEREVLQAQLAACQKTLENFEMLLATPAPSEKEKKQSRAEIKYDKKKRRGGTMISVLSLALAIVGAIFVQSIPALGISLLCVGALGVLSGLITVFRHTKSAPKKEKTKRTFEDAALAARYEANNAEIASLRQKLALFAPDIETQFASQNEDIQNRKNRLAALDKAIVDFLSHFRFENVYDYRTAIARLKEGVAQYAENSVIVNEYSQKLAALPPPITGEERYSAMDMENLLARKTSFENERERLTAETARLSALLEGQESRVAQLADYEGEESLLTEEKARLERRLIAVRTAKELLVRARANMANRYLEPVERACARYAKILGFAPSDNIRFSADGTPVVEENAAYRIPDYYSAGMQDLLGFCVRMALAETVFARHTPTLILDDPFANLDDIKTEKAKTLVKELSKKYQIIYFTCKTERVL